MFCRRSLLTAAVGASLALTLAACGSSGGGGSGPIVLGTTLPLTGPLGVFGPVIQAAYEQAVTDINASGGVKVGGTSRPLKLVVKDNKSDPTEVTSTARTLVIDNAVALLGSVTPPLTVPLSVVAEREPVAGRRRPQPQYLPPPQQRPRQAPPGYISGYRPGY